VIDFYLGQVQTPAGTDGACPAEVIAEYGYSIDSTS
jgi:hypothetical protein